MKLISDGQNHKNVMSH